MWRRRRWPPEPAAAAAAAEAAAAIARSTPRDRAPTTLGRRRARRRPTGSPTRDASHDRPPARIARRLSDASHEPAAAHTRPPSLGLTAPAPAPAPAPTPAPRPAPRPAATPPRRHRRHVAPRQPRQDGRSVHAPKLKIVRRLRRHDRHARRQAVPPAHRPHRIVVARAAPERERPRGAPRADIDDRVVGGMPARRYRQHAAQRHARPLNPTGASVGDGLIDHDRYDDIGRASGEGTWVSPPPLLAASPFHTHARQRAS